MKVKTTYLQMFARPAPPPIPSPNLGEGKKIPSPNLGEARVGGLPRDGVAVVHAKKPTVSYYRFLYETVGRDYDWPRCKKMSDAELAALLHDPRVEVHVLMVDGVPAGFAELDRRTEGEIELMHFGLMPEFIGQGLGRYFLEWTIDKAWSYGPGRFWLHTDTKDHPSALSNYVKRGFAVYKEEIKDQTSERKAN